MNLPTDLIYKIGTYDHDILYTLHLSGIPIHKKDYSITLLEYMIKKDDLKNFVKIIKELNPDYNETFNLLEYAVLYESIEIVKYIWNLYDFEETRVCELLLYCIGENLMDIVYHFFEHTDINIEYRDCQFLSEAVVTRNYSLVSYLLNHPRMTYPSEGENISLILAIEYRDRKMLRMLLAHPKIKPHKPFNQPLKVALDLGDKWAMQQLYRHRKVMKSLPYDLSYEDFYFIKHITKDFELSDIEIQ